MIYDPTDSEKNLSALTQMAAIVGLFIPGLVAERIAAGRSSPYVRYWARVSWTWSVFAGLLIAGSIVVESVYQHSAALVLVCALHVLFCVMGAFGAVGNTPFGYLFVGELFCRWEASLIWFDPRTDAADEDSDDRIEETGIDETGLDKEPRPPDLEEYKDAFPR